MIHKMMVALIIWTIMGINLIVALVIEGKRGCTFLENGLLGSFTICALVLAVVSLLEDR